MNPLLWFMVVLINTTRSEFTRSEINLKPLATYMDSLILLAIAVIMASLVPLWQLLCNL